jgi:hypothetical protein
VRRRRIIFGSPPRACRNETHREGDCVKPSVTPVAFLAVLFVVRGVAQDLTLRIPPVKASVTIDNQPIAITTTGTISGSRDLFHLILNADLSDLQEHIAGLLSAQVNRSDRCGERLSVERATLVPMPPASLLTAYVHFERWACVKALGREVAKRLVGGNGTIPVKLTPTLEKGAEGNSEVKLDPEVGTIEADGSLGEVLRSSSAGDKLRAQISASILSAMQKGANLQATLPPAIEKVASIESVRFADAGSGRLSLELAAEIRVPEKEIRMLIQQLGSR